LSFHNSSLGASLWLAEVFFLALPQTLVGTIAWLGRVSLVREAEKKNNMLICDFSEHFGVTETEESLRDEYFSLTLQG